jgi:hypothetical protein
MAARLLQGNTTMGSKDWISLGDSVEASVTDDGYLVSQPGDACDGEVRALLAARFGGAPRDWLRRTEWSADASGDVSATWAVALCECCEHQLGNPCSDEACTCQDCGATCTLPDDATDEVCADLYCPIHGQFNPDCPLHAEDVSP